eukprot:scaffold10231_cov81-Isochrysis_galbana.AAC.1
MPTHGRARAQVLRGGAYRVTGGKRRRLRRTPEKAPRMLPHRRQGGCPLQGLGVARVGSLRWVGGAAELPLLWPALGLRSRCCLQSTFDSHPP